MQLVGPYMIAHHRECDAAYARAEQNAQAADLAGLEREAAAFLAEMERHIAVEEELLFPAFEERTGMDGGPTETMRVEHEQMRTLFAEMRAAISARDAGQYLEAAQTLLALLQLHNAKEENMMYPMLDEALGEDAAAVLEQVQGAMA